MRLNTKGGEADEGALGPVFQDEDLSLIFDKPLPAPTPERPFAPFPGPYLAGPLPAHLQALRATGLVVKLTGLAPAEAAELVAFGALWLDDRPCLDPERELAGHQSFRLNAPAYGPVRFYEADPDRIVYEDRDILIYNKESGRPSQAVPHDAHNNVLAALGRLLTERGDRSRLWLSHRLDADTSGLLMMARNKEAAGLLGKAFQEGRVAKEYLCLGLGPAPQRAGFSIEAPIAKEGGRYLVKPKGPGLEARTDFTRLGRIGENIGPQGWSPYLFRAAPLTGRTHQIRLHLAWAGWPILGDRFYGRPEAPPAPRLMLASASLTFSHPRTRETMTISLPLTQFGRRGLEMPPSL